MRTNAGLWLDHRQAVIVIIGDHEEEIREIQSGIGKHTRYSAASHAKFSRGTPNDRGEDMRDRRFAASLSEYYDEVIARLSDASSILIMGPGEAKVELNERFTTKNLGDKIVGIETADKMTNAQIAAKVRRHFQSKAPSLPSPMSHHR